MTTKNVKTKANKKAPIAPPIVGINGVTAEALVEYGMIDVAPVRDARCTFAFLRLPVGLDVAKRKVFLTELQGMIERGFFSLRG